MQMLFSMLMASMVFVMLPRAAASAERVAELLDVVPTVADPATPAPAPERLGTVEFRDVEFRYPGAEEPVLSGISFSAGRGESRRSSAARAAASRRSWCVTPRLFDVSGGRVLIDGVDVRDLAQQDDLGAHRPRPPARLPVRGNRRGQRARRTRGRHRRGGLARPRGRAGEDVRRGDGGRPRRPRWGRERSNLSGGQRQPRGVARAVAKRPDIYIFDDSFSALDFATDARLRSAMLGETSDATVLIVAQRVGTVVHADRIVVLAEGALAGAWGRTPSCSRRARRTARSSTRSSRPREAA